MVTDNEKQMDSKDNQIWQKDLCSQIKVPETGINGQKEYVLWCIRIHC